MKKCRKCDELKEITEFNKDKTKKDGLQSYCRDCGRDCWKKWKTENEEKRKDYQKDYHKKWYEENKDKRKDYNKKWAAKNRDYWKDYKASARPCVYRIKHKQDGRYYLGQTTQHLSNRAASHFSPSSGLTSPFTGLNKDDWIVETLCYGTKKQVRHLEKVLLEKRVGIDPNCLNENK